MSDYNDEIRYLREILKEQNKKIGRYEATLAELRTYCTFVHAHVGTLCSPLEEKFASRIEAIIEVKMGKGVE